MTGAIPYPPDRLIVLGPAICQACRQLVWLHVDRRWYLRGGQLHGCSMVRVSRVIH